MTCLLSGLHVTRVACRDSIAKQGLLPACPQKGRPHGIYIFREDDGFSHLGFNSRTIWCSGQGQDVWQVGYFGRAIIDQYVMNGLILLDSAPLVSLVTRNENYDVI